jgi:hypothetical protein
MTKDLATMLYPAIALGVIGLAAWSLARHGRALLIDGLGGDAGLARSVNRLLAMGFCLITLGYVVLTAGADDRPWKAEPLAQLRHEVGMLLVVVGIVYFLNICVIAKLRGRSEPRAEDAGTLLPGRR